MAAISQKYREAISVLADKQSSKTRLMVWFPEIGWGTRPDSAIGWSLKVTKMADFMCCMSQTTSFLQGVLSELVVGFLHEMFAHGSLSWLRWLYPHNTDIKAPPTFFFIYHFVKVPSNICRCPGRTRSSESGTHWNSPRSAQEIAPTCYNK